uniref:uncharacterized protein sytl2a isoform X2 n=1 Tax=Semicossyphus pulcher TaxID=241346 RepID=UPI0037E8F903
MIDLSFLSEEEQQSILAVLRRDAELKKAEEKRVQNLQKTVNDKDQLKYMTGEWFYETKQLRHQDRIHGSDIIRASMRHTHKPLTILELSQVLPEKPSFVSSENKEVFVPPVLCGLLQEPHTELSNDRYDIENPHETPQNEPKLVLQSPSKERKNPFNSKVMASYTLEEKEEAVDQTRAQDEEPLPSSNNCISYTSDRKQDPNDSPFTQNASVSILMCENRAVNTTSVGCFVETDGPGGRQTTSAGPRSILKHLSPSSSSDSLFPRLDQPSPVSLDSPTETWLDRKQVRFSSMVSQSGVDRHDGKELGEHSLLDVDCIAPSEDGNDSANTGSTGAGTHRPSHKIQVDSQEDELNLKNDSYIQEQKSDQHEVVGDFSGHCYLEFLSPAVSGLPCTEQESGKPVHLETGPEEDLHSQARTADWPEQNTDITVKAVSDTMSSKGSSHDVMKPGNRLLREKEKDTIAEDQTQEEEVKLFKQKDSDSSHMISQSSADTTKDKSASVEQQAKLSELTEVRTLQLTAMQNISFKETVTSVDTDSVDQHPERLSDLKAFWERENSVPKIIFAREEAGHKDNKTGREAALGPQTDSDVESINDNLLPQMKMTVEYPAGTPQEKSSSPQTGCTLPVVLYKEDGTYRANPVLIYEETDDILTCSIREENIIIPVPSSQNSQKKEGDIPDPLSRQSSPTPQRDSRAKISDLKHFWEKELTKSKVIPANASTRPILRNKVVSPQSDIKIFLHSKETFETEGQTSPYKTNSNVVLKSLNVTDKGFVSQSSQDVSSASQQNRVEADIEAQMMPLSPSISHIPRSKDQEEETRRSPSKTCHPRVLQREASSPKSPRREGSPLKTFPIDIDPQTKNVEEHQGKLKPVPKERKSPSHGAKQTVLTETNLSSNIMIDNMNTKQNSSKCTSPQSKKASGKKLGTITLLARSFIPQDYQHYLGPHEKAHIPPFTQESDAVHSPKKTLRDAMENQRDTPTEGSRSRKGSWLVQNKDGNSSQDTTTSAWSLPRTSSGSCDETPGTILTSLKQLSSKIKSSSKSLDNLTSTTRKERAQDKEEAMNQSVDDGKRVVPSLMYLQAWKHAESILLKSISRLLILLSLEEICHISLLVSSLPLSSDPKQLKTSVSVPVLQQDETDSDSTFETILGLRRNTGSSTSNLSLSSGMASMSSVSGSISSIYPADFGDIEVHGSIQFAVNYIQKLGEFHIFVVHCRDLAVVDTKKNRSDPYVKCYLLPDKTKIGKRKTAVKKKSLNPDYNEILRFKILMEVLKTQNLNISVWHNDTFGRNSFLGDVDLDLSEWDFSNTQINEYALKARVSPQASTPTPSQLIDGRGQMRVALRFLLQTCQSQSTSRMETSEVQIWVKDCKNLPPVRGVVIDPFVKCTVLPDTSRKSRQKTRVVKRTANPMFNHTMVYDGFRPEDLREACVEITVWDHDRLNNHYIGGVRLGQGTGKSYGVEVAWMDSTADEANLWQRMLQAEGEWVEDVLPLRMLLMAKSMSK